MTFCHPLFIFAWCAREDNTLILCTSNGVVSLLPNPEILVIKQKLKTTQKQHKKNFKVWGLWDFHKYSFLTVFSLLLCTIFIMQGKLFSLKILVFKHKKEFMLSKRLFSE
jgi:hypothetical protein